jgi:hypothetical protein
MTATAHTPARTASGKESALVAFLAQLDRDGFTVTDLAAVARVGRSNLEQALNGARNGRHTWKHVIPLLSNEALFLLKQCSAWNNFASEAMTVSQARWLASAERGAAVAEQLRADGCTGSEGYFAP